MPVQHTFTHLCAPLKPIPPPRKRKVTGRELGLLQLLFLVGSQKTSRKRVARLKGRGMPRRDQTPPNRTPVPHFHPAAEVENPPAPVAGLCSPIQGQVPCCTSGRRARAGNRGGGVAPEKRGQLGRLRVEPDAPALPEGPETQKEVATSSNGPADHPEAS